MLRARLGLALVPVLLAAGAPADLDRCLSEPAGATRVACLEPAFAAGAPGEREIALLEKLVAQDSAAAARLAAVAEAATAASAIGNGGPLGAVQALRARLLDLRAESLQRLERHEESADAFEAALALDDGNTHLSWLADDGRVLWTSALDPGSGRQERAAKSFALAGRAEKARTALARALSSGAAGPAREALARLGGGGVPGLDPVPSELSARTWFPPLPDVELKLHGGGALRLSDVRGKVLLLDFWASWCAPCLHELPRLESLHKSLAGAGLAVVTVNARESPDAARSAANALKLTLPIGFYDDAVDRAFNVRALPTLVLADREGRVRARWDNYVPDFDAEVAAKVRDLLGADPEGLPHEAAEVLAGGGLLQIDWLRELGGPVGAMAVTNGTGGGARIAVASRDQLLVLEPGGRIEHRHELPGAGTLRAPGTSGRGRFDLVNFRAGRKEVTWVDSVRGAREAQPTAGIVLDVAALPASPPQLAEPRLVLGGVDGVSTAAPGGPETRLAGGSGEVVSVAAAKGAVEPRVVALTREGRFSLLDDSGAVFGPYWAPVDTRALLASGDVLGVGMLPQAARAAAVGRFLGGDRAQAAVATSSGQLVLVDLVTGEVRFRAHWPGISALAAGDLDRDGCDELLVGAGRSLAVLRRPPTQPSALGRAGS